MDIEAEEASLERDFDKFISPKQILFLSADLVGSTAMKQRRRNEAGVNIPDSDRWASIIQSFYSFMTSNFREKWNRKEDDLGDESATRLGDAPILWKTTGDEVVFRKYISARYQVNETIGLWQETVKSVSQMLKLVGKDNQIGLKCTAWLAEFPIQNRVLVGAGFDDADLTDSSSPGRLIRTLVDFEKTPVKSGLEIDFVGPAIDIGFRISKLSTARKFVVSIDVAFLLMYNDNQDGGIDLRYDGPIRLSGVFGGIAYPVFWIDMGHRTSSEVLEDNILPNPA